MLGNLEEVSLKAKKVLLRIDADTPIENGKVIDDERLRSSVPTIKYLLEHGAEVTIVGHIGRPSGKIVAKLKMRLVEDKLVELIGTHQNWQILENLRFNAGEEANDLEFAGELAKGRDLFVQDAFATCHRQHASIARIQELLPSYAGLSLKKEIDNLDALLAADNLTIIIGGKKAKDKLPVIGHLAAKAKVFLLGGVVGSTFLARAGYPTGKSLVEKEVFNQTDEIISQQKMLLRLPQDVVLSRSLERADEVQTVAVGNLSNGYDEYYIVDIGARTIAEFTRIIKDSSVIFWNGNMGVSEVEEFSAGTMAVARAIAASSAKKYAGGGDTAAFLRRHGLDKDFDFISNGGGATLEYLAGRQLPGL